MSGAIKFLLETVVTLLQSLSSNDGILTKSLDSYLPELYKYAVLIMETVMMPVAYTILALFFLLEIQKISTKVESGGGAPTTGFEMVMKTMVKMALCKMVIDSLSLILRAIMELSVYLIQKIMGLVSSSQVKGNIVDVNAVVTKVEDMSFWEALGVLIVLIIVVLVTIIAIVFARVMVVMRFFELYLLFAVSPLPIATLPHDEFSSVAKNFLKNFIAVSLQGVLIFLVLSFYPILINSAFMGDNSGNVFMAMVAVLGYSFVLIISIFATGKWSKSITNAS
ncbi:hypothetical protein HCA63_17040 [Listeria booriae]|uniref:type IV secretion system protein n=1 Tax=Listeria booriae TaxID=1552123 RepID=UPI0016270232|nr:type IV secretion system protein [Listeria booriae]MBC1890065.1 hypothetical protein [Listeria booriae]